jgi:hypothetical protein
MEDVPMTVIGADSLVMEPPDRWERSASVDF